MFDFLNFFSSGANVFATGTSLLNTYAQLRSNREKTKQSLYEQQHLLKQQQEHLKFDRQQLFERTAEYGAISSYHVDMLRQEQLYNRQQLGYNILKTGIGITGTDSAGLLLRHMAYMDEMKARSVEAEYFHQRPRSNLNTALIDLKKQAINRNISSINSAAPWQVLGTVLSGVSDLGEIARLSTGEEKRK
ncbi:hypothetical protein [Candidatus Tisiphia endosymbiont of Oplodontha viridula]|uniref:hypothetical protein n=1 Tax=Candidatus Tisiphia endosymbiont of Oplodontha viridula TaxID=3077925 RepID=UPI0035C8DC35